MYFQF